MSVPLLTRPGSIHQYFFSPATTLHTTFLPRAGIISNADCATTAGAIANVLFREYLIKLQAWRAGRFQQAASEDLAIFLLVNFNHRHEVSCQDISYRLSFFFFFP